MYRLFADYETYDLIMANKLIAQVMASMSDCAVLEQFAVEIDLAAVIDKLEAKSNDENIK
jgi:hypothetical protein